MRRASSWVTVDYPATKLFIEDVKDLVSALTTDRGPPTIRVGDYVFDSLDELIERESSNSIRNLTLDSEGQRYTAYVARWGLTANYYPNNDGSIKVFHDCDLIFKRCRNPFWIFYQWWNLPIFAIISMLSHFMPNELSLYLSILMSIVWIVYLYGIMNQRAVFIVSRRSTWQGFVGRNRDILVGAGSAIIGVVGTLIVQKFFP